MPQTNIVNVEELVPSDHLYRKFKELWDLRFVRSELSNLELHKFSFGNLH